MKLLLLILTILFSISVSAQESDMKGVMLDIEVARDAWANWKEKLSPDTTKALKDALRDRRSLEAAREQNERRCLQRGMYVTVECLQKVAVLELKEKVAVEWLSWLEGKGDLSREAVAGIEFAFCRAGFGHQQRCYMGD